ncbi:MAG: TIGR03086 family metal-binding protein [Nocardioidaceae bacterium]
MPGNPSTTTRWGGVELLERAIGYTLGNLLLVRPRRDAMSAPTPCAEWDLHALLQHMNHSLVALQEAADVRRVARADEADSAEDLVATLRDRACRLLGGWTGTRDDGAISVDGRPLTANVLTSAGALEIVVHGWDVARACRTDRPIPDALAEDLLRIAPVLVTEADRPARFAAPVEGPPSAAPGDRLLRFLGRDPGR